ASGTVIAANTLGLTSGGQLARTERSVIGIWLVGANGSQVVSNVIGGYLFGAVVTADDVSLLGNFVGTNPTGTQARPNTVGVYVPGEIQDGPSVGDRVQIGASGAGNVISGNQNTGLLIGGDFIGGGAETVRKAGGPSLRAAVAAHATLESGAASALSRQRHNLPGPLAKRAALSPEARRGEQSPDSLVVAFNRIGTDRAGREELGNGRSATEESAFPGVWVRDGRGTRLLGNVVGGNGFGVLVFGGEDAEGLPREVTIAGSLIGARADGGGSIPNQYGGVALFGSENNTMTAATLTEGGDPVGNIVRRNGSFGVLVRPIEGERGNTIRSTSFIDSRGPSIELLNGDLEYPAVAPPPPNLLSAVVTEDGVRIRARADRAGEVDVFAAGRCGEGEAEGVLIATGAVTAGVVDVPVTLASGADPLGTYLAATLTDGASGGSTSAFSDCVRVVRAEDVVEVPIAPNETGPVLDDLQIEVDVTENSGVAKRTGGGGTLTVQRYGAQIPPVIGPFEGSATAPGGATVTPNAVSSNRHWLLRADGLSGVTYTVCVDGGGIGGIADLDQIVLVNRPTPRDPWRPLATTRTERTFCAEGLTSWGEIGIGGDDAVNPVPTEPTPEALPSALAVTAFPNPARGRATVRVALPASGAVRAVVSDVLGREVAVLHDGPLSAGTHALVFDATSLTAGLYAVRVNTPTESTSSMVTVAR
ncbi:MAG: hypothetical protein AAFQ43_03260, partial [Bacteroidota bacterium]